MNLDKSLEEIILESKINKAKRMISKKYINKPGEITFFEYQQKGRVLLVAATSSVENKSMHRYHKIAITDSTDEMPFHDSNVWGKRHIPTIEDCEKSYKFNLEYRLKQLKF